MLDLPFRVPLEADSRPLRLHGPAVAARRNFEPFLHAWTPSVYVIALPRHKAKVAGTPLGHARGHLKLLEYLDRQIGQVVELSLPVLGLCENDHLDLIELMAALDASDVAPGAHLFPPKARGVRDV